MIPTHKRPQSLERTLLSIDHAFRDLPIQGEVLVIHSEKTPPSLYISSPNLRLQCLYSESTRVNHKRNIGLVRALGDVTLFLDDDCEVTDSQFFLAHLKAHETSEFLAVGGPYQNQPQGYWSRLYSETQMHWQASAIRKEGTPPFVGGNLSLKTGPGDPWIRFNETLCFGGTETELIARLVEREFPVAFDPNLVVIHHVRVGLIEFLKKAFLQGRSLGAKQAQTSETKGELPPSPSWPYKVPFQVGQLCGLKNGTNRLSIGLIFHALLYLFLGWPAFWNSSEQRAQNKAVSPWALKFFESYRIWMSRGKGKVRWLGAYLKSVFFWRGVFRLWMKIRPQLISLWLAMEKVFYWHGLFRVWNQVYPPLSLQLKKIYWNRFFKPWMKIKPLLSAGWVTFIKLIYWKGLFRVWMEIKPLWDHFKLTLIQVFYWQSFFKLYWLMRSHFWRIYQIPWIFHLLFYRLIWPSLQPILKPYYFLKYQWKKRIASNRTHSVSHAQKKEQFSNPV